ncbi:MAG: TetR/AcrR family transcriptional regulator [Pseudomonadales bacterium]
MSSAAALSMSAQIRSRKQPRAQLTKDKILDSAVALYLSDGIDDTTVSEIIKQSGVGRTTFYRYFKDQDEVLNQAVIRDFEKLIADFDAQRFEHDDPAVQIVEDICWFNRQLRSRPALRLLFSDRTERLYQKLDLSVDTFERLGKSSAQPTYDLARKKGMLRKGINLKKYVEWSTFTLVALQTASFPFTQNEFSLRDMLRDFLVPALINVNAPEQQ